MRQKWLRFNEGLGLSPSSSLFETLCLRIANVYTVLNHLTHLPIPSRSSISINHFSGNCKNIQSNPWNFLSSDYFKYLIDTERKDGNMDGKRSFDPAGGWWRLVAGFFFHLIFIKHFIDSLPSERKDGNMDGKKELQSTFMRCTMTGYHRMAPHYWFLNHTKMFKPPILVTARIGKYSIAFVHFYTIGDLHDGIIWLIHFFCFLC